MLFDVYLKLFFDILVKSQQRPYCEINYLIYHIRLFGTSNKTEWLITIQDKEMHHDNFFKRNKLSTKKDYLLTKFLYDIHQEKEIIQIPKLSKKFNV